MILEVNNLYKSYGTIPILENISFKVKQGDWIILWGKSGCGKTTLLQLLGLLDKPQKGVINYNLPKLKASNFRQKNIGFIFQNFNLINDISALENIMLPALFTKKNKKEIKKKSLDLIKMIGLENRLNHRPNSLSGGEQQRIAIARALINSPKIILADEPTGNLDKENANKIIEIFNTLHKQKKTIIMVTHSQEYQKWATQIINLPIINQ